MNFKLGPAKTGAFQGFGMKIGAGAAASSKAKVATGSKPQRTGVSALFADSLEDDTLQNQQKAAGPTWAKPTLQEVKAQREAEELLATNPTVFLYDELIDDEKAARGVEAISSRVRTDVFQQKKRTGLTLMDGSEAVKSGCERLRSKYVGKVIVATDRRKVEQQMIEDRALKKDKDKHDGCEVFVTEAFKDELKRRKTFEEELETQELRDQQHAAEGQKDGKGFASMYRNLLNSGLASSRGGEKLKDLTAAYESKDELSKEESEGASKEEVIGNDNPNDDQLKNDGVSTKTETTNVSHGVAEVATTPALKAHSEKLAAEADKKAHREERAMSAKDRYLARKRTASAMGGE